MGGSVLRAQQKKKASQPVYSFSLIAAFALKLGRDRPDVQMKLAQGCSVRLNIGLNRQGMKQLLLILERL